MGKVRNVFILIVLHVLLILGCSGSQIILTVADSPPKPETGQTKLDMEGVFVDGGITHTDYFSNAVAVLQGQPPAFIEKREEEFEEPQAPKEPIAITISFAGDCTIGTDVRFGYNGSFSHEVARQKNNYAYFFRNVKPIFEKDDLTLVNLEGTFTNATKKGDKKFCFKGEPKWVEILKQGSVEMVNISNNHIYDYLNKGFQDTVTALEDAGIYYSGEGNIAYYSVDGIIIASLGYNGWTSNIKDTIAHDLKEVKPKAHLIIISFHWGQERHYIPNSVQIDLGRWCIDEGASVVVGHHPHVVQGIEKYKDRYILYSLGNFCFGGNRNPSDKDTMIFQNTFLLDPENKEIQTSEEIIIPCSVSSVSKRNNYQPTPLEGKEGERVLKRIYHYSSKLKYGIRYE